MDPARQDEDQPSTLGDPTIPLGSAEKAEAQSDLSRKYLYALSSRYTEITEIAQGGMGAVYRAKDLETGDLIALKVIKPEIATLSSVIERFKSELLLARKVTHKNVCRTYELLRFEDVFVITMEYVEGESLRAVLKSAGGVSLRRGMQWAEQICSALQEAHSQGVIHRDLKPENILIARNGTAKITDFGIARSLGSRQTQIGSTIGTPAYMSPEQAAGQAASERSDIYSLGLILYEIFTGRPAFQADSAAAFARMQLDETPPAPLVLEPLLPAFLDAAIQRCLEKDPKKRFQSVAELWNALNEGPVTISSDFVPQPAPRLRQWRRTDSLLVLLGLLALVYFLGVRDKIFPARHLQLEVDALGARHVAEEAAARWGKTLHAPPQVSLEYISNLYPKLLLNEHHDLSSNPAPYPVANLSQTEVPFFWRANLNSERAERVGSLLGLPEEFVTVTRAGKLAEFKQDRGNTLLPKYVPPAVEMRRALARNAVEQACGKPPPNARLIETSGGDWGASYSAEWKNRIPGSSFAAVSLWAEKVVQLNCYPWGDDDTKSVGMDVLTTTLVDPLARLVVIIQVVALLIGFGMSQGLRAPILPKRMALALLTGFTGTWLYANSLMPSMPSLPIFTITGLGGSGLALVGFVLAEQRVGRWFPGAIASYLQLLRGTVLAPEIGLAVLRGTAFGFVLIALETALVWLSLSWLGRLGRDPFLIVFSGILDPTPTAAAMTTFSPALYIVASALFHGLVFALGIGLGLTYSRRSLQNTGNVPPLRRYARTLYGAFGAGFFMVWSVIALHAHFGYVLSFLLGNIFFAALIGIFLALLALRYDLLTVFAAVATATLWRLNYPLLSIFEQTGNSSYWLVFCLWGAVLLAAAAVALRPGFSKLSTRFTQ